MKLPRLIWSGSVPGRSVIFRIVQGEGHPDGVPYLEVEWQTKDALGNAIWKPADDRAVDEVIHTALVQLVDTVEQYRRDNS